MVLEMAVVYQGIGILGFWSVVSLGAYKWIRWFVPKMLESIRGEFKTRSKPNKEYIRIKG